MRSTAAIISNSVLLACLLFQFSFCSSNSEKSFDYFILSREWPFSFCSIEKCKHEQNLPHDFNIHGLWPQGEDGSRPNFCSAKFNETQLEPLNATLLRSWVDLKDPIDYPIDFWKEEYKKHGSCAASDSDYNSTFKYFAAALNVSLRWPIIPMLKKYNIAPGNQLVNVTEIRKAVQVGFGFNPSVRCVKNSNDDDSLLYEIRICVDKELQPRQCDMKNNGRVDNRDADLKPIVGNDGRGDKNGVLMFREEIQYQSYRNALNLMNSLGSRLKDRLFSMQQNFLRKRQLSEGSFECPDDSAIRIPEQPV